MWNSSIHLRIAIARRRAAGVCGVLSRADARGAGERRAAAGAAWVGRLVPLFPLEDRREPDEALRSGATPLRPGEAAPDAMLRCSGVTG